MTFVGFFVYLLISAFFAFIVDRIVPRRIPGGFIAATIVGVIGGMIAVKLGPAYPAIFGVAILPVAMGSFIMVVCLALMGNSQERYRTRP
ncbi:MAG: hypothetical protein SFY67_13140 [Candidatus Melainabacteria bacterium]|nr:hypothetical protein [Candidatus Melainabacteria bacterium]